MYFTIRTALEWIQLKNKCKADVNVLSANQYGSDRHEGAGNQTQQ